MVRTFENYHRKIETVVVKTFAKFAEILTITV
jgi:hypothetical protein